MWSRSINFNVNATKHVVCCKDFTNINLYLIRHCSEEKFSPYGRQLGGYEHRDEVENIGVRSKWRTPFHERKDHFRSKLAFFGSKKFPATLTRYNPDNWKYLSFDSWWNNVAKNKLIHEQRFIKERLMILGCDLAAAHFVVFRGGAVKFYDHENWIRDTKTKKDYDEDLPNVYDSSYILEAIDLSKSSILYEGLQNLKNLNNLKSLSFAYCLFFDNWCFDKISGMCGHTLEYLDISHTNVTYHAFNVLYRFQKLKTLKVTGLSYDPDFLEVCLEVKRSFPHLEIVGLDDTDYTPIIHPDLIENNSFGIKFMHKVIKWLSAR